MPKATSSARTLVERRFAEIAAEFRLEHDELAFARALWAALLDRAAPNGADLSAADLPLLEEALFWALAARAYQTQIARDGFLPTNSCSNSDSYSYSYSDPPNETPPSPSSSSSSSSSSQSINSTATPAKTECEFDTTKKPALARKKLGLKSHPLTEPYAKARERYRKLMKEILERAARRLESNPDAPPDIAAALLPLLKRADGVIEQALEESS